MRGRTNIVQRVGATVNGDVINAKCLEDIEAGDFVSVEYVAQQGKLMSGDIRYSVCEKVSDSLFVLCYESFSNNTFNVTLFTFVNDGIELLQTLTYNRVITSDNPNSMLKISNSGVVAVCNGSRLFLFNVVNGRLVEKSVLSINLCVAIHFDENNVLYAIGNGIVYKTSDYVTLVEDSGKLTDLYMYGGVFVSSTQIVCLSRRTASANWKYWCLILIVKENGAWVKKQQVDVQSVDPNSSLNYESTKVAPGAQKVFKTKGKICFLLYAYSSGDYPMFFVYEVSISGTLNKLVNQLSYGVGFNYGSLFVSSESHSIELWNTVITLVDYDLTTNVFDVLSQIVVNTQGIAIQGVSIESQCCLFVGNKAVYFFNDSNHTGFWYYKFTINGNEIVPGWNNSFNGVRKYVSGNPMGFAKTGGAKNDVIPIYVPLTS